MSGLEYFGPQLTQSHVNASDFFHSLQGKVKKIADEEAAIMANSMERILKNRRKLKGGNGRYPRWIPKLTKGGHWEKKKSNKSFAAWSAVRRPSGEFWLYNGATSNSNYNYPHNLVYGTKWNAKVMQSVREGTSTRLVARGGKIFSTQMPNGLVPWLKIKRVDFEDNIKRRMTGSTL